MFGRRKLVVCAALALGAPAGLAAPPVYSNDFEDAAKVGKEWSAASVDTTPRGNRKFLGPFTTDKVTLKVGDLPRHKYVRISLELFVIQTWDGSAGVSPRGSQIGPDAWRMEVDGGAELVAHTFSNLDFEAGNIAKDAMTQTFPALTPGPVHAAKTGAAENNTLGYEWSVGGRGLQPVDSVYKLTFTVPHDGPAIQFNFAGAENLQPADDECWGLDNVKIEALDAADLAPMDEKQIARLWGAIGGADPAAEFAAFWQLVEAGDALPAFLKARVKKSEVDRKRFAKLVLAMDGDDFAAREKATEDVAALGPAAEALIREAVGHSESLEVKTRLMAALKKLNTAPPNDPEQRTRAIALRLLGLVGTDQAKKVALELSGK